MCKNCLFRFIPASFRSIPVSFRFIPVHSGVIPVNSGSFRLIPVHSAPFRCLVTPAVLLLGDTEDQYGLEVGTLICVASVLVSVYLSLLCCLFCCSCVCACCVCVCLSVCLSVCMYVCMSYVCMFSELHIYFVAFLRYIYIYKCCSRRLNSASIFPGVR